MQGMIWMKGHPTNEPPRDRQLVPQSKLGYLHFDDDDITKAKGGGGSIS